MIPLEVSREQLNEALTPLYELLGTNAMSIFQTTPLSIDFVYGVTFAVAVGDEVDKWGRPKGFKYPDGSPQGRDIDELAHMVRVAVQQLP